MKITVNGGIDIGNVHFNGKHLLWIRDNVYHREDGPAVISENGYYAWWLHGALHRADGPAVIWADGHTEWYKHGKLHREDGPAIIHSDGVQEWYKDHKKYRNSGTFTNIYKRIRRIIHMAITLRVNY